MVPQPYSRGFPGGSDGKESAHNAGDLGSIRGLERSTGEVKGYPLQFRRATGEGKGYRLQYSVLENSLDCTVHGVTKSQTGLSDFHFHFIEENII